MRVFSVIHKFSKYKTNFKYSLKPKSRVTAVMRGLFCRKYDFNGNFSRFCFSSFCFLLTHFYYQVKLSRFCFSWARFYYQVKISSYCFSSFCFSSARFYYQVKLSRFHISRFYFSLASQIFTLLLLNFLRKQMFILN